MMYPKLVKISIVATLLGAASIVAFMILAPGFGFGHMAVAQGGPMRPGHMGGWMRPAWGAGGFVLFAAVGLGMCLLPAGVLTAVIARLLKPDANVEIGS
jgi:hypothetical protein